MKPNTPEQTVNNQAPITNQFNINGVGNPFKDLISNFENSNSDDFTDPTKDITY